MMRPVNVKTSAHYQREYRKRLREQGLIKREIWIRPEHVDQARAMEKHLRELDVSQVANNGGDVGKPAMWSTAALFTELHGTALVQEQRATLELIDGADPTLLIVMREYGDLPVFLTAAGQQIIVESVLWRAIDVKDPASFNDMVLRTDKYFPLSTICLGQRAQEDYYLMFGALSAASRLVVVEQEIEMLANNVIDVSEACAEFLDVKKGRLETGSGT